MQTGVLKAMRVINELQGAHDGETIVIVGNGKNLELTPPEDFAGYASIGMNTIVEYEDWVPDYYIAVDRRVPREFGDKINARFKGVNKVLPYPRLYNKLADQNSTFYFRTPDGLLWPKNGGRLWQDDFNKPLIYGNSMHIAIKMAYFMGASTILLIGMEHEPHNANEHFWGIDEKMSPDQPTAGWLAGYKELAQVLKQKQVRLLNISKNTFVPASIIPTASVRSWKKRRQ